jgi:co-chaperonin GroES (HSP10)
MTTFTPLNGLILVELPDDTGMAQSAGGLFMPGKEEYVTCRVLEASARMLDDGTYAPMQVGPGDEVVVRKTGVSKPGLPCPCGDPDKRLIQEADIVGIME